MMLRILYLISLFLFIELSFCYNYLDDNVEHNINNVRRNLRREKVRSRKRPFVRKSRMRQEDDYDRSPVEFDVASFMQPENEHLDTAETVMKHRNTRRLYTPSPIDYGSIFKDDTVKIEQNSDYENIGDINPLIAKGSISTKKHNSNLSEDPNKDKKGHDRPRNAYKDESFLDQSIHEHDKKGPSKTLKFPFFSHNKSEPMKTKKNKKRFFFFGNLNKQEFADMQDLNSNTVEPYKMKRSYEQRLCPACKKIFIAQTQKRCKKNPKRLIHNSREFFQLQNTNTDSTLKDVRMDYGVRRTRSSNEKKVTKREDKDRQMKELNEVQKKVDNVEIRIPHFEMPTPVKGQ